MGTSPQGTPPNRLRRAICLALALLLGISGCGRSYSRPVVRTGLAMSELTTEDIGKQVTVELKDGRKHHGTLVSVDTQQFSIQITGNPDPIVIPMAEIMSAHVKEGDPIGLVLIVSGIAVVVFIGVALFHFSPYAG